LADELNPALQANVLLKDEAYFVGEVNSPVVLAKISPTLERNGIFRSYFADFKVSNPALFNMPYGPAAVAAGVEYRREIQTDIENPLVVSKDVFGLAGGLAPVTSNSRKVGSAFAEFNIPVWDKVELTPAARVDKFSIVGTSVTPKVGIKWTARPNLAFRSTVAKGFRAPTFRELSPDVSTSGLSGVTDPRRCNETTQAGCGIAVQVNTVGDPTLQPEKTTSFTTGVIWEPIPNYSLTLDYYRIERRNQIRDLSVDFVLANEDDPNYSRFVSRRADGSIVDVTLPYRNVVKVKQSGLDLDLKGRPNLGQYGRLFLSSRWSYTIDYKGKEFEDSVFEDSVGKYLQPDLRGSFSAAWEKGAWVNQLSARYIAGYDSFINTCNVESIGAPGDLCQTDSSTNFDWSTQYRGIKNVNVIFRETPI
jgi:iron complex outermembrane recepter protein